MTAPAPNASATSERRSLTVLIAEDEEDLAEAIELTVAELGHFPLRVRDGAAVLEALRRVRPDVLLLDMSMPVLDGFDVLRALGGKQAPPVIAMSSFREFLIRAPAMGAAATLRKPFKIEQLEDTLAAVAGARPAAPTPTPPAAGSTDVMPPVNDELERLRAAFCLRLANTSTNEVLDHLVKAAAYLLHTRMSMVTIITETQQWWKATHGLDPEVEKDHGMPREYALCTHAVAAEAPLIVSDARKHPVFHDFHLVKAGVLVSYAGVPIRIPSIGALGTLCVFDSQPRAFSRVDLEVLGVLAARASAEIEWHEREPGDPRPPSSGLHVSLIDEVNDIYTPHAFASYVGVIARLALVENRSFALCGLVAPAGEMPDVIRAARKAAGVADAVGWLDDRSVAAVLPRADEAQARAFGERVTTELGRPVQFAAVIEQGSLNERAGLSRLRRQLLQHPPDHA
jgi:DNA-binding response OmpR family regulator